MEPAATSKLTPKEAAGALVELSVLQAALAAVIAAESPSAAAKISSAATESEEPLIDVEEAARRLGVTRRFVYRHAKDWPFTRKIGPKTLRFEPAGLEKLRRSRLRL